MDRRIDEAYDNYADMLYRLALTYMQNPDDAQDAVQDVFLKYMTAAPFLRDDEHERAWLIRVTVNRCCDLLRRRKIRSYVSLDEISRKFPKRTVVPSCSTIWRDFRWRKCRGCWGFPSPP